MISISIAFIGTDKRRQRAELLKPATVNSSIYTDEIFIPVLIYPILFYPLKVFKIERKN